MAQATSTDRTLASGIRWGALKAPGHQYPCALVEQNRLIVAYSVNKEHMELLTVDPNDL